MASKKWKDLSMQRLKVIANNLVLFALLIIGVACKSQNNFDNHKPILKSEKLAKSIGTTVSKIADNITIVFQDQQNNYWFGSKSDGVFKYDVQLKDADRKQRRLTHFTTTDGLCTNSILGIQEDDSGNIYFDTPNGVSKFDGQQFTTLEVVTNNYFKNEWVLKPTDLWFTMGFDKSGPFRYDGKVLYHLEFPKTKQEAIFYTKYPDVSFNPYGIYIIYKDSKGHVWFGTASLGLCRYDGQSINWLYEVDLTETPNGGDFGFRSIIEDKAGYFWFNNTHSRFEILSNSVAKDGTNYLNYRKEKGIGKETDKGALAYPYFLSVVEDNQGDLWMVTYDEGVWRYNGKELVQYLVKEGEATVLLYSIYKDRQGVLWLGTPNHGAYKFNGKTFEKLEL